MVQARRTYRSGEITKQIPTGHWEEVIETLALPMWSSARWSRMPTGYRAGDTGTSSVATIAGNAAPVARWMEPPNLQLGAERTGPTCQSRT